MTKKIIDNGTLIAIIGSLDNVEWGNNFITENELPMQLGVMRKNKSTIIPHVHKIRERQLKTISCEFHYVVRGKMIASFYNLSKVLIDKVTLMPNMYVLLFNGGHGYDIIEDDTVMLEVKLGNYSNREDDKEDVCVG